MARFSLATPTLVALLAGAVWWHKFDGFSPFTTSLDMAQAPFHEDEPIPGIPLV